MAQHPQRDFKAAQVYNFLMKWTDEPEDGSKTRAEVLTDAAHRLRRFSGMTRKEIQGGLVRAVKLGAIGREEAERYFGLEPEKD